jgi:bacterioferritin-associated ferredoxin
MIRSCICHRITFEDIVKLAAENNITRLPVLRDRYNICNKCKLCNPYVREALVTGQTEFPGTYKPKRKHDRKNKMPKLSEDV